MRVHDVDATMQRRQGGPLPHGKLSSEHTPCAEAARHTFMRCVGALQQKMQIDKEGRRDSGLQDASGADTSAASSSKGGTTTTDMATGGTERVEATGAAASAGGHGGERGDADTSAPPAPPAD